MKPPVDTDVRPSVWQITWPVMPLLAFVICSMIPIEHEASIPIETARSLTGTDDPELMKQRFSIMSGEAIKFVLWSLGLIGCGVCIWIRRWPTAFPESRPQWSVFTVILGGVVAAAAIGWAPLLFGMLYGAPPLTRYQEIYHVDWSAALKITMLCLYAPVVEEIVWRGWLQRVLTAFTGVWAALALQAIMFGLAHWSQGIDGMIVTGLIGAVLGGVYLYSGKLWPCMVAHSLINLLLNMRTVLWLIQGRPE